MACSACCYTGRDILVRDNETGETQVVRIL